VVDVRNTFRILVGKPEGKGTLGRSKRRWTETVRKLRAPNGLVSLG
jgi:hypothetical protein